MGYRTCPYCGANLDPGEICDCEESREDKKRALPSANDSAQDSQGESTPMDTLYPEDGVLSTPDKPLAAYYSIIPAPVRYHRGISPSAKLLYGEISALCGREGFAWASNAYFARLFDVTERQIIRLIKLLEEQGFVHAVTEPARPGQKSLRKIYLGVSPPGTQADGQKCHPMTKISPTSDKNVTPHNIYNNINNNINTPSSPKKQSVFSPREQFSLWVQARSEHWLEDDVAALLAAFDGFLEARKAAKKPVKSQRAVTLLCNRLEEHSGGIPGIMVKMLDQAVIHGWQSVYPLQDNARSKSAAKPPRKDDLEWL